MALQINQYSKTRTDLTIQDDDLLDFDSTEDSGTSYESAKITVSDFLAYVSANVSSNSIYTADDTILADRTLTASGAYTKWNDGDIKIDHTGESDSYGFIIEFSSSERGQLGFNQLLQSAFLELQNFDIGPGLGTFFNAIDGKVAIGHGTATSTLHIKGSGSTAATTNFLAQNSVGNDLMTILDNGFVGIGTATPTAKLQVIGHTQVDGLFEVNSLTTTAGNVGAFFSNGLNENFGYRWQVEDNGNFLTSSINNAGGSGQGKYESIHSTMSFTGYYDALADGVTQLDASRTMFYAKDDGGLGGRNAVAFIGAKPSTPNVLTDYNLNVGGWRPDDIANDGGVINVFNNTTSSISSGASQSTTLINIVKPQGTLANTGAGSWSLIGLNVDIESRGDINYSALFNGGNVGIGTTTPTEKLDVNGRQFLSNQTAPATPTGGGTIYVEGGALKYIGSSGTITTLGVA